MQTQKELKMGLQVDVFMIGIMTGEGWRSKLRASRKWQIHCLSLRESAVIAMETFSFTAATTVCRGWHLSPGSLQNEARWLLQNVCSDFHLVLNLNSVWSERDTQSVLGAVFCIPPLMLLVTSSQFP